LLAPVASMSHVTADASGFPESRARNYELGAAAVQTGARRHGPTMCGDAGVGAPGAPLGASVRVKSDSTVPFSGPACVCCICSVVRCFGGPCWPALGTARPERPPVVPKWHRGKSNTLAHARCSGSASAKVNAPALSTQRPASVPLQHWQQAPPVRPALPCAAETRRGQLQRAAGWRLSCPKNSTFFGQIEESERDDESSLPVIRGPRKGRCEPR